MFGYLVLYTVSVVGIILVGFLKVKLELNASMFLAMTFLLGAANDIGYLLLEKVGLDNADTEDEA
ncbi:MAG: hypothetical protein LBN22_03750 [Clostridiales Family XIII bacterium]|jgi:hypothetical protein|nr:hypothetical protein [Clostridiales Family XIII bacterium]